MQPAERPRERPQRAVSSPDGVLPLGQRGHQTLRWPGRCRSGGHNSSSAPRIGSGTDAVAHRRAEGSLTDVRRATGIGVHSYDGLDEVEGGGVEGGVGGGDGGTEGRVTGCILMVVLGLNAWAVFTDLLVGLLVARPGDALLDGVEGSAGAGRARVADLLEVVLSLLRGALMTPEAAYWHKLMSVCTVSPFFLPVMSVRWLWLVRRPELLML